ncbi:hypothetical protein [uncultured Rothia sp.]|uniref:hypothetical protein n=1 Tax=uncultured Rothia sp. TaxID=316088 RepID=UPI0025DE77DA|nr:hypothetical protein [uncultured Rothia sp.]
MKKNVSTKRNNSKKKKNKVTFKEYLRRKAEYMWNDRGVIIFFVGFIAVLGFIYFMTHYNPNNNSEICTIESVEIIEHEDPYAISGEFETEECGTITMWHAPDGERIYPYLNSIEAGKKYRAYKSFDTRNDETGFTAIRFEEIKE